MDQTVENVNLVVSWLRDGQAGQKYQAALAIRGLASNPRNKKAIREAGGIQGLMAHLDGPPNNSMTVVTAETISCLIADDLENRKHLRESGGVGKLVLLLANGPECESTHRALLALRILTDREEDRVAIMEAGGFSALVNLLRSGADSEITEYAAAALGNIAAGSQTVKNALREAGAIPPLLRLLREDPEEISAELAVVVLRNLSLQNPVNRKEIQERGGLNPLLQMLSNGLDILRYPLPCSAEYFASKSGDPPFKKMDCSGQCCFDPQHGHLCISAAQSSRVGCFGPGKNMNPRNKKAERFSLLRKLSIVEPNSQTLELNFLVADKQGVPKATRSNKIATKSCQRLFRVTISPCAATEIKGGIMRMLTRIHMEREFGVEPTLC